MLRLLRWLLIFFVIVLPILAIAVTNRQKALLVLDPFSPDNPALSISLPLFVYLFASMFIGILIGSTATWVSQGKWRKRSRQRTQEAHEWRREAGLLKRQLDMANKPQLPSPSIR